MPYELSDLACPALVRSRIVGGWILIAVLATASVAVADPPAERLDRVRERLDDAGHRLTEQVQRSKVLAADISGYNERIRGLQGQLTTLRGEAAQVEQQLAVAEAELGSRQRDLRAERARLVRLRARLATSRRVLSDRLVALYKADDPDVLTVVLETDGFEQLLENAAFLRRVDGQDRAIVLAVSRAKAGAERQEERLARLEAQQQVVTSDLGRERDRAVDLRDDVLAIETQLTSARDERQRSLDTLKVSSFRLQDEVAGLERTQSRVQRTLTAAQSDNSDEFGTVPVGPATPAAGGWVMPVTGPLTSPFCEVRSYEACHPGIDIAAPEGTPIRVASSGRVVLIQSTEASGGTATSRVSSTTPAPPPATPISHPLPPAAAPASPLARSSATWAAPATRPGRIYTSRYGSTVEWSTRSTTSER